MHSLKMIALGIPGEVSFQTKWSENASHANLHKDALKAN